MSEYSLLKSLLNPPLPEPEPLMEVAPPADNAPFSIVDADDRGPPKMARGGSADLYHVPYTLSIELRGEQYPEGVVVAHMVNVTLAGLFREEDNSFSYEYGSQRGIHGGKYYVFDHLQWVTPQIPHAVENYDLFQLEPDQLSAARDLIVKSLTDMDEDEIARHVNVESIITALTPDNFNEPDDL